MRKERTEVSCRNTKSKDGTFTPRINKPTAERLIRYCSLKDLNKTKFVEQCVNERLDALEREFFESMSKDELIDMIMG